MSGTFFTWSLISLTSLLGVGLVFLCIYLKAKSRFIHLRLMDARQQLSSAQELLTVAHQQEVALKEDNIKLRTDKAHLLQQMQEHKMAETQWNERLQLQFKDLANELLEAKSRKFTAQNQSNIEALLRPLGEKITAFEKAVVKANEGDIQRSASLGTEIRRLYELNARITQEAANLTKAIKGNNKVQGDWGEFILESILEKSGLAKGREYFLQHSFTGQDQQRLRLDALIKLPGNKHIIVDAKASLIAYDAFVNTQDDNQKSSQLKQHLQSVRQHIKTLSAKNYHSQMATSQLDFVLMFIPIEPAFSLAVQYDRTLFQDAYQHNVILVSPTTLMATLRTITNIWRSEHQNRNALEIAQQSGNLYDKFVHFMKEFDKVEIRLHGVQAAHEEAKRKLYTGRGNLISRIQRLKTLGAAASKQLDTDLLERAQQAHSAALHQSVAPSAGSPSAEDAPLAIS